MPTVATLVRTAVKARLTAAFPGERVVARKRLGVRGGELKDDTASLICVSVVGDHEEPGPGGGLWRTVTVAAAYVRKRQGQQNDTDPLDDQRELLKRTMHTFTLTGVSGLADYAAQDRPPVDLAALASYYDAVIVAVAYEVWEPG